jgi:hypothetical protein
MTICATINKNKTEVVRYRCTKEEKLRIELAAFIDDRKVTDFLRHYNNKNVEKILNEHGGFEKLEHFFNLPDFEKEAFKTYLEFLENYSNFRKYIVIGKRHALREDKHEEKMRKLEEQFELEHNLEEEELPKEMIEQEKIEASKKHLEFLEKMEASKEFIEKENKK